MKKILFILLTLIITLPSCTNSVPVVKKDRVYIYYGEDKFGEIEPVQDDYEILVREYNKNGILLKETDYAKSGNALSVRKYEVNGENIVITQDEKYILRGEHIITLKKDKNGHWIKTFNGDSKDLNLEYKHFDIKVSFLTDEIGKNLAEAYTLIYGKERDVKYSYKHTKFNENGNWLEGELTEEGSYSTDKTFYIREILEYWD